MDEDYDLFENLEDKIDNIPVIQNIAKTPEEQVLDLIVETCKAAGGSIIFDSISKQIKEILKLGALHTKRRDALLDIGVKGGLFIIEWPKISLLEPIEQIPIKQIPIEPKDAFGIVLVEDVLTTDKTNPVKPIWTPPEGWTGPKSMDCGHNLFWWGPIMETVLNEKGKRIEVETETQGCLMCLKKYPANPSNRKGVFANQAIPISFRATVKTLSKPGWPGFCCDETGTYIGGDGNNCQYTKKDDLFSKFDDNDNRVLCVAHRGLKK